MNEEISKNVMKTGTSLVGLVCKDGVVIAADRRATIGSTLAQKDMQKVRLLKMNLIK